MSSGRNSQNSSRQPRKLRRESPNGRREKPQDLRRSRSDHDKYRSDQEEPEKDRKKKENVIKSKRARSPRRNKDGSSYERKNVGQRKELRTKTDSKDKAKDKKSVETVERHPLFQDNSRLAQLIAQITSGSDESSKRVAAAQSLLEYVYDAAHIEPLKRNCSNIFSALEDVFRDRGQNELKDKLVHCYASIGHVLGIDCDKFFQWVFSKIPSAANDQLRVLYLRTISEAISLDVGKQVFYDTMPMIMASLQDVLENADAPELLLVILDVLVIVARDYTHIFAEYFRDTVDILVGWHIDTTQSDQLTQKTAECLISFHPYWVSDMRFSLTLLGQFLEDMEAYAEELNGITNGKFSKEDTPSPYISLPKLTALTKVFTTVVSGLREFFSPGREAKITAGYITETVDRIISCVDISSYDIKFEKLLVAANHGLSVLVDSLGHSVNVSCSKLINFVNAQLKRREESTYKLLKSALQLAEKVITVVGQALPAEIVPELLSRNKPMMLLRTYADGTLLATILKIFQTLLSIKNIPMLEQIYKLFVEDIVSSYNLILNQAHSADQDSFNEEPIHLKRKDLIQAIIVFDLAGLAEIATFKSSVTGAWKVEPSTYTLITSMLDPTHPTLTSQYPAIQFAMLSTLFCHSQRCNNFVPSAKTKSTFHSIESEHLIQMLCKLLIDQHVISDVKCLCILWISSIAASIAALPMDIQKRQWNMIQVVHALVLSSYSFENNVREATANCIIKLTKLCLIHPVVLGRLLAECLPHLMDTNEEICEKFKKMVVAFPADLIASLPTTTSCQNQMKFIGSPQSPFVSCQNDLLLVCKKHMCRFPTGTFDSHKFKVVMEHLLDPKMEKLLTEDLFSTCQRLGKISEPIAGSWSSCQRFMRSIDSTFPSNAKSYDVLLWFWLAWESANFCILSRLKTPLGKALDTFQSIEGVLKDLEKRFKERLKPDGNSKKIKNKHKDNGKSNPEKYMIVHQAVLLLQFLENLEKLMYNAYEGTAISLPPANRVVRNFFRTNRSTCCEWLHRIQEGVTILASLCGSPEKAIRSGFSWLEHLKNTGNTQGTEFERAIVTVVDALTQLHCHEGIQGVLEWSRKTVGRNFFWLYGASIKARGSLETAADQLKQSLKKYLSPDRLKSETVNEVKKATVTLLTKDPVIIADALSTQFLVGQATDCYLQLCDWTEVQEWNKRVNELRKTFPSVQGLYSTIDHSYVKAMMKFEEHDFAAVHEQLELIPGATVPTMLHEQFPVLGTVKDDKDSRGSKLVQEENPLSSLADNLSPQAMLCQSRIYLMQALTLYWTSGLNTLKGSRVGSLHSSAWETVDDLLTEANIAAMTPLKSMLFNHSSQNTAPFLMQLKSIAAIRETLMVTDIEEGNDVMFMNVYGRNQFIDASRTDISILNEALRTTSYLQFHHSLHKKGWVGPAIHANEKLPNVQMLQVMTAKLARKQGNKKLAESLLAKQLSLLESKGAIDGKMYLTGGAQLKLKQLSASVSSGKVVDPLAAVDILKESAKLKLTLGNVSEAIDVMCSSILLSERQLLGSTNKSNNSIAKLSETSARSFLTLAKWIHSENRILSPVGDIDDAVAIGPKVREVIKVALKSGGSLTKALQGSNISNMSEGDIICGQLLYHSTFRCPSLGKTWFAYADWCYKWGRKIVEQESTLWHTELLTEEKEAIKKILPKGTAGHIVNKVINVMAQVLHSKDFSAVEEDLSTSSIRDNNADESDIEKLKRQFLLVADDILSNNSEALTALIAVWQSIVDRVFAHYKQAAIAYFTYLKLNGTESFVPVEVINRSEYENITATLRLLRLLVKYSGELRQHLEDSFTLTPTKPWRSIIPQLFARLNHPESYVQNTVANLICRIGKDSPQLIVYQTVVGCSDMMPQKQLSKTSTDEILRAYQYENDDECEQLAVDIQEDINMASQADTEEASSQDDQLAISVEDKAMLSSLHIILDTLNEFNLNLVQEVKCVVQELRRITLLWDELWLGSLTQLHQEAQRRIQQLTSEVKRVNNNQTLSDTQKSALIKEKHVALMKPIFYALERLYKITSQPPETPHEKIFQNTFGQQINKAIDSLKNPVDPSSPELSWENSKQLYQTLQLRAQKRTTNNLAMAEISPTLAKSDFKLIPLPGIESSSQIITLKGFSNDVQILPTKTKPKKLVMTASDGQKYAYLFKGLEDLHLDERIMQFLEICNNMFAKEDRSGEQKFFARHYSVTPLGPRSGLIQWVDGATPLFTLYRRWQQREAAAQVLLKNQVDKTALPQTPSRPTELFYNKINPLLREKGISSSTSRKDWPLTILRRVLQELSNETPADLLSRELWCACTSSSDWWRMMQKYSRSVAVMSVIGYVLGLGDRHLDNILIDLTTGEVVHIDYNVCFEKGKALRVPEKVPFRMTRNMETALGVTGVEGIFRSSCERILQSLRSGREILLTLLEAFVYDPLIDWTTANDAAFAGAFYGGGGVAADEGNKFSRKEMERSITQTLLSTRVTEMKVSWTNNKDELIQSLNMLKDLLGNFCQIVNSQWYSTEELNMLELQASLLNAALVNSNHPLHSLQARYDKQGKLLGDLNHSKMKLKEKMMECNQIQKQFQAAYLKVQSDAIHTIYAEVCKLADVGAPSYAPAVKFLNSAGQSNVVTQCEQIECELSFALNQRRTALQGCVETILSYSEMVQQFSYGYMYQHRLCSWISLLSFLYMEPASQKCKEVLEAHEESLAKKTVIQKDIEPLVRALENKLYQYSSEQNNRLIKLRERRNHEQAETTALSGPVTETWNALRKFIGDAGVPGATSLACVTVTALSTLNKRQLVMENAAAVAGNRLMHLTSRDGDWFLDELCTMCGNISQLLSVLKNNALRLSPQKNNSHNDVLENITVGMQVVLTVVKVYTCLQELISNFRSVTVPETVQLLMENDPSILKVVQDVREMIESSSISLSNLCEIYQKSLVERSDVDEEAATIVNNFRNTFEQLLEPSTNALNADGIPMSPSLNAGQTLLAGFSSSFSKMEAELLSLYEVYRKLKIPEGLDHIDLQQEQRNLKKSRNVCSSAPGKWQNFLFVKKLSVMNSFFDACVQQSGATRDVDAGLKALNNLSGECDASSNNRIFQVFNEELLCMSVKQFIAESVQLYLIGIPSQALTALSMNYVGLLAPAIAKDIKDARKGLHTAEELCKRVVDYNLKSNAFPHHHLSQASALINAHDAAWRKHDLARRLDASIALQKNVVERAQLQLARFQWLHEESLFTVGKKKNIPLAEPTKQHTINEIKKRLQLINQVEQTMPNLMERYGQLQASIEQRLKWASGANPAVNVVLQDFAEAVNERKAILQKESNLTPEIHNVANAIIKMETFRANISDANMFDQTILSYVQECQIACEAFETCMEDLGDVEQFMKSLQISMPPKEAITTNWMKSRLEFIDAQMKAVRSRAPTVKSAILTEREVLKSQVSSCKNFLTSHHALVGEVKSMLKTLAKDEEAEECWNVRYFIQAHNKFSEDSSIILKKILTMASASRTDASEEVARLNEEDATTAVLMIDELTASVNALHTNLLKFGMSSIQEEGSVQHVEDVQDVKEKPIPSENNEGGRDAKKTNATLDLSEKTGVVTPSFPVQFNKLPAFAGKKAPGTPTRDPKTGKALQERNVYALNVWKRVKAKLEGRDVDSSRRVAVSEQVANMISESISLDNLAQLYEGWTPWV